MECDNVIKESHVDAAELHLIIDIREDLNPMQEAARIGAQVTYLSTCKKKSY